MSPYRVLRSDRLAGFKTMNYLSRQLAFEEAISGASSEQCGDALLLSPEGEVLETAHSNLFARFGREWVTPPAEGGLLPGTVRSLLLEEASSLCIVENRFTVNDLKKCHEVVLTNSVRGVISVSGIVEPGEKTQFRSTEATDTLKAFVQANLRSS